MKYINIYLQNVKGFSLENKVGKISHIIMSPGNFRLEYLQISKNWFTEETQKVFRKLYMVFKKPYMGPYENCKKHKNIRLPKGQGPSET